MCIRDSRTEVQLYKSLLFLKRSIDRDLLVSAQREAQMCLSDSGYYVKIVRPKQQAEDDAEFEDDGYGEGLSLIHISRRRRSETSSVKCRTCRK